MRRLNCGAATTKRIQHNIAFVAGGTNNPFQQGERLLGIVTKPLLRLRIQNRNVAPDLPHQRTLRLRRHNLIVSVKSDAGLFHLVHVIHQQFLDTFVYHSLISPLIPGGIAMFGILEIEGVPIFRFCIEEDGIVHARELLAGVSRKPMVTPDNLVPEHLWPENAVQNGFDVVTRRYIAVEVETAGVLEEPVHLKDAECHITQVCHLSAIAEHRVEPFNGFVDRERGHRDELFHALVGGGCPKPRIIKRLERCRLLAFVVLIQPVKLMILLLGIERRIAVDEVHEVLWPLAHNVKVIAVVQSVEFGNVCHNWIILKVFAGYRRHVLSARLPGEEVLRVRSILQILALTCISRSPASASRSSAMLNIKRSFVLPSSGRL